MLRARQTTGLQLNEFRLIPLIHHVAELGRSNVKQMEIGNTKPAKIRSASPRKMKRNNESFRNGLQGRTHNYLR